jgi:hypothetical protein
MSLYQHFIYCNLISSNVSRETEKYICIKMAVLKRQITVAEIFIIILRSRPIQRAIAPGQLGADLSLKALQHATH